ncbi:MAG: hypothetical protein PVJ04_15130, partial [Gemmatimonadota bacterium]
MSTTGNPSERTPGFLVLRLWVLLGVGLLFLASPAAAQIPSELTSTPAPSGTGWPGFADVHF